MVITTISCNSCGKWGLPIKVKIEDESEHCSKCRHVTENYRTFHFCSTKCLIKHMRKVQNHDCSKTFARTGWDDKKAFGHCYICFKMIELTIDQVSEEDKQQMLDFKKTWKPHIDKETEKIRKRESNLNWCSKHQVIHKIYPKYKSCRQ